MKLRDRVMEPVNRKVVQPIQNAVALSWAALGIAVLALMIALYSLKGRNA